MARVIAPDVDSLPGRVMQATRAHCRNAAMCAMALASSVVDRAGPPQVVGDFFSIDDFLGTVEDIGIKTPGDSRHRRTPGGRTFRPQPFFRTWRFRAAVRDRLLRAVRRLQSPQGHPAEDPARDAPRVRRAWNPVRVLHATPAARTATRRIRRRQCHCAVMTRLQTHRREWRRSSSLLATDSAGRIGRPLHGQEPQPGSVAASGGTSKSSRKNADSSERPARPALA